MGHKKEQKWITKRGEFRFLPQEEHIHKDKNKAMSRPFFFEFFDRASRALPAQFYGARRKNSELDKKLPFLSIFLAFEPTS